MSAFTPVGAEVGARRSIADERDGVGRPRCPRLPEHTVRVEAAAAGGRPVFFGITGPWTQSSRGRRRGSAPSRLRARHRQSTALRHAGPDARRRAAGAPQREAGTRRPARRVPRRGRGLRPAHARRGCSAINHVAIVRCARAAVSSHAIGKALFNAGVLWLTYLGLEPYVRRFSPDSLIGWTRLVAGGWRDPRVGRDVHDRRRRRPGDDARLRAAQPAAAARSAARSRCRCSADPIA